MYSSTSTSTLNMRVRVLRKQMYSSTNTILLYNILEYEYDYFRM
ncbi:hypothetical protein NP493_42g03034 [Ridgeia piscesae]|uniref:Uncharacterized protein n=1 Tax=Ridgeia piscesae TaxID=27915 RepID=A0AAD9UJU8_RIDPI|nr:hypothetical protein NP493_42g03034 [Ridgeia piscesae]